ncbi:MAG: Mini-ribonuclease 3 [Clostridia bacterium]|nr:Mini-ribonuclease 3 [Clostridia bacterium]
MKTYQDFIDKIANVPARRVRSKEEIKNLQPLVLALVGDSVESLLLRRRFAILTDFKVNEITKAINSLVNASAQAQSLKLIEDDLTQDEQDVARRARNTHTHSTAKNYDVVSYRHATAFEAVLGFNYLSGNERRIELFLDKICSYFAKNGKI